MQSKLAIKVQQNYYHHNSTNLQCNIFKTELGESRLGESRLGESRLGESLYDYSTGGLYTVIYHILSFVEA